MRDPFRDLYNEYAHSALPRRDFMARLPLIEPNYVQARQTEPDGKRLDTKRISFNGPNGAVKAYVAKPRKLKKKDRIAGS